MGDELVPSSIFEGLDAAQQIPADVPQAFNALSDQAEFSNVWAGPDATSFNVSQSLIGSQDVAVMRENGVDFGKIDYSRYANGFMDAIPKLLNQLRGNSGQDRSPATGRARPQRSVADLLGMSGGAGAVSPQNPGSQGMWMLIVVGASLLLIMLVGGARR